MTCNYWRFGFINRNAFIAIFRGNSVTKRNVTSDRLALCNLVLKYGFDAFRAFFQFMFGKVDFKVEHEQSVRSGCIYIVFTYGNHGNIVLLKKF